ncbi:MAG: alpha/beta hydrolase [Microthrixaceae bacterium]|nr:alpha/beta hydrolase [Microthrixaceae bacterium]
MRRPVIALAALVVLAGAFSPACGSDGTEPIDGSEGSTGSAVPNGERVDTGAGEALVWGDGPYGVVLAHGAAYDAASWEEQAPRIADQGATVVAVEDISPEGIEAGVAFLADERGVDDVALVGASAGAAGTMELVAAQPDLPDQIILLSPNSVVEGLGPSPKLFIASEDEPVADVSTRMAEISDGDDNEALLVPGSTHAQGLFETDQAEPVIDAMLDRLGEFADD